MAQHLVISIAFVAHVFVASSNYAYPSERTVMDCAEIENVRALPEALGSNPITSIDCAREIIAHASSQDIEDFNKRVSERFELKQAFEFPSRAKLQGEIEVFWIDFGQKYFWILSFWRDKEIRSVSVRAIYKSAEEVAEDVSYQFRPEFFKSKSDAVEFLNKRYGRDDQKIISALEASGATLTARHVDETNITLIYESKFPDRISELYALDDSMRFILKYENDKFVGFYKKP